MTDFTIDELLYGKDDTQHIVNLEVKDDDVYIYTEVNGKVEVETYPMEYFILSATNHNNMDRLTGNLFFEYKWTTEDGGEFKEKKNKIYGQREQYWFPYNVREMAMLNDGLTYFKGLQPEEVSILSFDIEAEGLKRYKNSEVYCIANTFRSKGKTIRKMFREDEYKNSKEMIDEWCSWVRTLDPTFICGANIYIYDLPYLDHVYRLQGGDGLHLGRDNSLMTVPKNPSQFRFDGSRTIPYKKCRIFGREIVDTWFLSMRYDIGREFPSYGLKPIIEHLGMVKKGRVFYDASKVKEGWAIPEEREKIVEYCKFDGDDALALYDLMIPAYFALTRYLPMTLEDVLVSASGAQLNNLMIRSYLMKGHSIPMPSDQVNFQGAFSYGKPGVHKNVFKIDVASLYPSIMRQYKIYDPDKDPLKHLLTFVDIFTDERLENKRLYKETGDEYYNALQAAQKIVINSFYGFLGASGLHFNYFHGASEVTRHGRAILNHAALYYCGGEFYIKDGDKAVSFKQIDDDNDFIICNADTDSISFVKTTGKKFESEERIELVDEINDVCQEEMGDMIIWEDDGLYDVMVVLKTKNYALKKCKADTKKGKSPYSYKGSSIKDKKAEPTLIQYKKDILHLFLDKKQDQFIDLYRDTILRTLDIGTDKEPIELWANRKTITKAVLNNDDKIARDVREACKDIEIQLEDKINIYKTNEGNLKLIDNYDNDHDAMHYISRVYASTNIFENIIDMDLIPKYSNAGNKDLLAKLIGEKDE